MDIQSIISQVTSSLSGASAETIQGFLADPASAIQSITGMSLGEADVSQVVSGVQDAIANGGIDLSGVDLSGLDLSSLGLGDFDLSAVTENLGGITEGLGGILDSTPLGGIAEGLSGLFGGN